MAEFADDPAVGSDVAQDAIADVSDRRGELGAGLPVRGKYRRMIESERRWPGVLREVEFRGREDAGIDGTLVGAEFGFGKFDEEAGPFFRGEFADIAHDGGGAVETSGKTGRVLGFSAEEFGIMNLELTDLVGVSGRDAATGRAAGFMAQDVDAIVFPSQIEDAVGDIAHHAAFIDE